MFPKGALPYSLQKAAIGRPSLLMISVLIQIDFIFKCPHFFSSHQKEVFQRVRKKC